MNALAYLEPRTGIYYGLRCPHCKSHRSRRFGLSVYLCETCDKSFTVVECLKALGAKESK